MVPAATVALVAGRVGTLLAGAVGLTLCEAVAGLWIAQAADVPPGPAVAVLGGVLFALTATASRARAAR